MTIKSIGEGWKSFRQAIAPLKGVVLDESDMERAFYAGAHVSLELALKPLNTGLARTDPAAAERHLKALCAELDIFFDKLELEVSKAKGSA